MVGITRLLFGVNRHADNIRYHTSISDPNTRKPIVVWNITQRCNLACRHCYSNSNEPRGTYTGEYTTQEAKLIIDSLAEFKIPVLLFSGGEPLLRKDLFELIAHAVSKGIRTVISTNGTLIDSKKAQALKNAGVSYVGISIDGLQETHDRFRGLEGAFERTLEGVRFCMAVGLKVGFRFTVFKGNKADLHGIFDLVKREKIPRICIYHLAYSGRGSKLVHEDLSHDETRDLMDTIIEHAIDFNKSSIPTEILTVDNHCDGPYLYLKMKENGDVNAEDVLRLLMINGGNSSGSGIASIDWEGNVYPDQFWRNTVLGNINQKSFAEIWSDPGNELLQNLRNRKELLPERCRGCGFLNMCNGNLRARGDAISGFPWGMDPACYLADDEISSRKLSTNIGKLE